MILSKNKIEEINPDEIISRKLADEDMESLLIVVPTNRKIRHYKRELISASPNKAVSSLNLETIGSLASKILSKGLNETSLISEEAAIILLKQSFNESKLNYFSQYRDGIPSGTLQRIKNVISEYKRQGITADSLLRESQKLSGTEKNIAEDIVTKVKGG